jgi:S-DNA-T family DNA segregation ATPase FtsK/SpoIIIE
MSDEHFDWKRREQEVAEETDSESAEAPVLVDSPKAQRPERLTLDRLRNAERRPILAPWLRSVGEFVATVKWGAGFAAHTSAYHATRTPKYAGKLLIRAPRGGTRLVSGWVRWLLDLEGEPVRQAAARKEDADAYGKLSRQRDRRVRWRGGVTTALLIALLIAAVVLLFVPPLARWASLTAVLVVLGVIGAPADRPLLDVAVDLPEAPKLTSDMVGQALRLIGVPAITQALAKNPKAINHVSPIHRDGPGWRAEIDLPMGATAADVGEKRAELAANLRRPLGCVWPEGRPEVHPGRLILWVGDKDMAAARQPAWPLTKGGVVDLFKSFPFGTDQRGRIVPLTLMFASMVVGSIPRMGKTFAMRLALLAAALDVRAELHAYDLKGTGDFSVLEPVAHRYRAGDDEDDIAYAVADLRGLQTEQRRRAKVIRELPRDLCPENKITPELASTKSLRLHPIVIGVDECQRWFEHPEHGAEIESICDDLVRRGPALGIIAMFGTQRPDKRSIPTGIRGNVVLRFCLKVMGQPENDMVLGTSAYKNGIQATLFARSDRGIGYLAGEGDDPVIVRTYYVDGPAAERIVARARTLRERAGTLSGHALGEDPQAGLVASLDLLHDLLAVVPASEPKAWNQTAVARLAELRPEVYGGWKAEQLTVALKPYGVGVGQVWGTDPITGQGANRQGFIRLDIVEAARRRRDGGPA